MSLILLALLSLASSHLVQAADANLEGQENATWAGSIFLRGFDPSTREKLTDAKVTKFAHELEHNGIRYAYVFAGPYMKDGHLPEYAFSAHARASVMLLKKAYPQIKILPWIGGVEGRTVFVESEAWLRNSLQDTARLMESAPFDGVHVDLEYVLFPKKGASTLPTAEYDAGWVRFHKQLRERLPRALLSTAAVSSALGTRPWKHKHALKDLIEVSRNIDQIAFMYYETNLHEPDTYRGNMRLQLEQIQEMKAALGDRTPEYLFGIGTFKSERALKSYRDMRFENVSGTLTTLSELLRVVSPSKRLIDGLAIYCEWLTIPEDWAMIRADWTKSGQ